MLTAISSWPSETEDFASHTRDYYQLWLVLAPPAPVRVPSPWIVGAIMLHAPMPATDIRSVACARQTHGNDDWSDPCRFDQRSFRHGRCATHLAWRARTTSIFAWFVLLDIHC